MNIELSQISLSIFFTPRGPSTPVWKCTYFFDFDIETSLNELHCIIISTY